MTTLTIISPWLFHLGDYEVLIKIVAFLLAAWVGWRFVGLFE